MVPQDITLVLSYKHIITTVLILFWVINLTDHLPQQILSVLRAKKVLPLLSFFLFFFLFDSLSPCLPSAQQPHPSF